MKTIKILKDWNQIKLDELIGTLNINHLVSDEDSKGLSSTMIEGWSNECDSYLRSNGYTGGKLNTHSSFLPDHGAVYVVFDESQISYDDASKYLIDVANRGR